MKKFSDWFDPNNKRHVMAWLEMRDTGRLPGWIGIDNGVEMDIGWQINVCFKMANEWAKHIVDKSTQ